MKLSIVSTLYKSALYIEEFHRRASAAARQLVGDDYEIVLVHDGSSDNSLELAVGLSRSDPHTVVIDLSRNFGHHKAMMTGLAHARGERLFLIDSDLEEEPEWLSNFTHQMEQEHCDVVYGIQTQRKGGVFERCSGQLFYCIFRILTHLPLSDNIVVARLMTRRYVDALLSHEEREVFLAGLWVITGFEQHPQMVEKHNTSKTTYTFSRKMSLLVNSVTSFTNAPLVGIFYFGVIISATVAIFAIYFLIYRLFFARPISGWTSVIVSIWLLGGFIIAFIGILGIYISKIFSETKRRPYTIVRQIYGKRGERK
jgi:putative glycosyltransferase